MSDRETRGHDVFATHRAIWKQKACVACAIGIACHLASLDLGEGPYNWRRTQAEKKFFCERECGQELWEASFNPKAPTVKPSPVAPTNYQSRDEW